MGAQTPNPILILLVDMWLAAVQAAVLYAGARVGAKKIVRAGATQHREARTGGENHRGFEASAVATGGMTMDDPLLMTKGMNDSERLMFMTEFNSRKKDSTTAILLALFLGGLGAHHFYLGKVGLGILYLVLVWTLIPGIVALIECFLLKERVRLFNTERAGEIILRLKALRAAA